MQKIHFNGLQVSEFVHPAEQMIRENMLSAPGYKKTVSAISEMVTALNSSLKIGKYTKLTKVTAPYLFDILENTCRILDVKIIPDMYLFHSYSQSIIPCGTDEPFLVLSDYIVQFADREMLYYLFGNAITMIKADHVQITNIASCMTKNIWLTAPQIAIKKYLHVADATSDRGGLLACQDFSAVARCQFLELGMPMSMVKKVFRDEPTSVQYVEQYLAYVTRSNQSDSTITKMAEKWININYVEAPANDMLRDIFQWYRTGYLRLMQKYRKNQGDGND